MRAFCRISTREETHSKPRLRYRKFCGSLRDDRRDRNHEKNARRRRKAGPARGRKDISGCVAVASFAATSSQKQVMSLMSCSPFSPKPHVPRVCAPSIVIFFQLFCFQTNNIMVRASIRDNRLRPRLRLGGGDTVGTENRRRGQTLRMRGAGRASGPVALPGGE